MPSAMRQWLKVETCSGRIIVTEKRADGVVTWEELSPNGDHAAWPGREAKSVNCHNVKLGELIAVSKTSQGAHVSSEGYLEKLLALALREPPDAKDEPGMVRSHEEGARIEFSIERFQSFDATAVSVECVEPVDELYRRFGGRCLVLRNLLTEDECSYLMREMEGGLAPTTYRQEYRKNDRCIFDSPELAELLYKRVEPFVGDLVVHVEDDSAKQHLSGEEPGDCPPELRLGYGMEGVWRPRGLNECLRFCKYNAGGFFRKHCDAMYRRNDEEQSLFTCMFYLNGELDGGATRFLKFDCPLDGSEYKKAGDGDVLASVPPEPGLCILFFQNGLLHEGEDLYSGEKYILRTDMMFHRDPETKPVRTDQEIEALALLRQAQAMEEKGGRENLDMAWKLYRRAFKLDSRLERLV